MEIDLARGFRSESVGQLGRHLDKWQRHQWIRHNTQVNSPRSEFFVFMDNRARIATTCCLVVPHLLQERHLHVAPCFVSPELSIILFLLVSSLLEVLWWLIDTGRVLVLKTIASVFPK